LAWSRRLNQDVGQAAFKSAQHAKEFVHLRALVTLQQTMLNDSDPLHDRVERPLASWRQLKGNLASVLIVQVPPEKVLADEALTARDMAALSTVAQHVKQKDREGNLVPVGHMCGHDMHVTWLVGATALLAQARESWRGTLMAVFQPAEETAKGARAMIDRHSGSGGLRHQGNRSDDQSFDPRFQGRVKRRRKPWAVIDRQFVDAARKLRFVVLSVVGAADKPKH
jgi:hypothetical protein